MHHSLRGAARRGHGAGLAVALAFGLGACLVLAAARPRPALAAHPAAPPRLGAKAVRVQPMDPEEPGGALPEPWLIHGDTEQRSIASVSKLFALMVVLDRGLDMDGTTKMLPSDHTWTRGGARSRLQIGWTYRNRDLVTAALMSSDNRAVLALGRAVGLSREELARAMVEKAHAIGLKRVGFAEPTGLSYDNQASAEGLVLALRAALEYEPIRVATSTTGAVIVPVGRKKPREPYNNTNRLVRWGYEGILGGKTGFNREAGNCLIFALRVKDGRRVAVVILGAPTRNSLFLDAKRLYAWTQAEAERRPPKVPAAPPVPEPFIPAPLAPQPAPTPIVSPTPAP